MELLLKTIPPLLVLVTLELPAEELSLKYKVPLLAKEAPAADELLEKVKRPLSLSIDALPALAVTAKVRLPVLAIWAVPAVELSLKDKWELLAMAAVPALELL